MATFMGPRRGLQVFFCALLSVLGVREAAAGPPSAARSPRHAHAQMGAYLSGPDELVVGGPAAYRVVMHWTDAPGATFPLADAVLRLELRRGGRILRVLAHGRSDGFGEAALSFTVPKLAVGDVTLRLVARSRYGKSVEQKKIQLVAGATARVSSDKPLYRPGQTIRTRALVLGSVGRKPVAGRTLIFLLSDPRGTEIARREARTSAFGIAAADFPLAQEVNLGRYRLQVRIAGEKGVAGRKQVEVKRYVLPTFSVSLKTSRKHYRPGQRLEGGLHAKRFTGKDLKGAKVELRIATRSCPPTRARACARTEDTIYATTDAKGRVRFSLPLPKEKLLPMEKGEVEVRAIVIDRVGDRREAALSLPFTRHHLKVALIVPGGGLWEGHRNRLHVLAAATHGESLRRGTVILRDAMGVVARAPLDALGTASFSYGRRVAPRCFLGGKGRRGVALKVEVLDTLGHMRTLERCVPVVQRALRVQPREALIARGQRVALDLVAPGAERGERAYVDVVKEGQIIATKQVTLKKGKGSLVFEPSAATSGLLTLIGRRAKAKGGGHGVAVYVEAPTALQITARLDRKSYRPGKVAKLALEVRESVGQKPVQAALGLRAVDKALLSLVREKPESAELFFALARYARVQSGALPLQPAGRKLAAWLGESSAAKLRQRAVGLLLSAVRPPGVSRWETDPWQARRDAWEVQAERLAQTTHKAIYRLRLGRKVGGKDKVRWVFRRDLVARLVGAGYAKKADLRDPWGRAVRPAMLRRADETLVFSGLAAGVAQEKLARLYQLIAKRPSALGLKRVYVPGLKGSDLPLRLPRDLMRRLARHPRFTQRWLLYDPWGSPWRVAHYRRLLLELDGEPNLLSQQEIFSWGPDGKANTDDDVRMGFSRYELKKTLLATLCGIGRCSKYCKGCAMFGYGVGGGRLGGRRAMAPRVLCGAARVMGALMGPHADRARPKVRSRFVETLLWRPEVITDRRGRAEVSIALADGITTYRLFASASSREGLFGTTQLDVRVFQPFYASFQLPSQASAGDELTAAVLVHNHTAAKQQVRLTLKLPAGVVATGGGGRLLTLAPKEVRAARFGLRFVSHGRRQVVVEAEGKSADGTIVRDALRREIAVRPDGAETAVSLSGSLSAERGAKTLTFALPRGIITDTSRVRLSFDAGPMRQALDGLESMLRSPHGCFEQTSATVYPNMLVLEHLRRTRRSNPKIEKKARDYLAKGYQRLLTFEVKGGGFSWFGRAPANQVLTAYGLMEFSDMARLRHVDAKLIARTRRWIEVRQQEDGSWGGDKQNIRDGVVNLLAEDKLRRTAYITRALLHSGSRGKVVQKALRYLRARLGMIDQSYTLALVLDALARAPATAPARKKQLMALAARLWKARRQDRRGALIPGPKSTLTYGGGASADLEATGLAASALLRAGAPLDHIKPLVDGLVARRSRYGGWATTQATILALQTLLSYGQRARPVRGRIEVFVDGRRVARRRLVTGKGKSVHLDLSAPLAEGSHRVALRFAGRGEPRFRLVGHAVLPYAKHVRARSKNLQIRSRFSRAMLSKGETAQLKVAARNRGAQALPMVMVSVPLPPGMHLEPGALARLAKLPRVQKVQLIDGAAVLYLDQLAAGAKLAFALPLAAKRALAVRVRPAAIWEYYRPENRGEDEPQRLVVR